MPRGTNAIVPGPVVCSWPPTWRWNVPSSTKKYLVVVAMQVQRQAVAGLDLGDQGREPTTGLLCGKQHLHVDAEGP